MPGPSNAGGERWNVNLPAVVGVVFVFLVGVIVWVVASSGGDADSQTATTSTLTSTLTSAPTSPTAVIVEPVIATSQPGTTTPAPMPEPSVTAATVTSVVPSAPVTTAPVPVTTAPRSEPGAVVGDLAVAGRPMQQPGCDNTFITVIASAVGDNATAGGIARLLETYPGSNYLRTDQTCPSLTQDIDGEPIYVVYFGPFVVASDACAARAQGSEGAYARRLSTEVGPDHGVACG